MVRTQKPNRCDLDNVNRDNVVCVRRGDGKTCQGDSGGPLVADKDSDGRWVIYGVTSYGFSNCEDPNDAAGFADVAAWTDTIIRKVRANP